jgi:serine/threonine-protein kinase RsbW
MFELVRTNKEFRLKMSATLENIEEADNQLTVFLNQRHLPVDIFAVRILLREALLNAVIHGSGKDPDLSVHFDVRVNSSDMVLTIEDFGPGFAWADRKQEINVLGDGGRGLALMKIYSDTMTFSESGNRLTLKKNFKMSPEASGDPTAVIVEEVK